MKKYLLFILLIAPSLVFGASSSPQPEPDKPKAGVADYNEGCALLLKKEWPAAQSKFEAALAADEKNAEAHNNLAYVLRKQGEQNFAESLRQYNRALELKPKMAEAYMYRGALHLFMGHKDLAQADLASLKKLHSKLAKELEEVLETGKEEEPERFYGVSKKK